MTEKASIAVDKQRAVELHEVTIQGEKFLKISNYAHMRPFLMSIVSNDDHWMFIGSNGGLSAGRKNADYALFPYYTDDKIIQSADNTGSKSIFRVELQGKIHVWEPFSVRYDHLYSTQRNLYKSPYGHQVMFEEINHDLGFCYRCKWSTSPRYGFVRETTLINQSDDVREIEILDGIQNILPYGVGSALQQAYSNLAEAYKRTELHEASGLGIYALSAIIADKAEPSEALKANVVWSAGLDQPLILLSSTQLEGFRKGKALQGERDVKGEAGAYFLSRKIDLPISENCSWKIVADLNKSQSQIVALIEEIKNTSTIGELVDEDVAKGSNDLVRLVASADGLQFTADNLQDCRHFSNVLFNVMRGGIFDDGYTIDSTDFKPYIRVANRSLFEQYRDMLDEMPDKVDRKALLEKVQATGDPDLIRLATEYLPLKFSRRHGDPSRPWNRFSINIRDEQTQKRILDYEGNWRDIFQNWEALAYAYPEYLDGMIFKFLNASTFDGYNPYRITKDGFDWEVIEPDDPWSYIGYWGDHQIIYLQKFLEQLEAFQPGRINSYLDKEWLVYAAVPYVIKPYQEITANPKDTIHFDHEWDSRIREKRKQLGADGALLFDAEDTIYRVNLLEKLLATLLAKLSNFIPGGGIWMNTQRPEWNDANNALVGNGVSMVTLYYLRRYMRFLLSTLEKADHDQVKISQELVEFYHSVRGVFENMAEGSLKHEHPAQRKVVLDALGDAGSDYRSQIYKVGFWGKKRSISMEGLLRFLRSALQVVEGTIRENKRSDGMYHAYNLMTYSEEGVSINRLDEMLEGQVAVLSAGLLDPAEALEVLHAMKKSALFRPDQYSYLLYPNKALPGFLEKNHIPDEAIRSSKLLSSLLAVDNTQIIERDILGTCHFNGLFRNAGDLNEALNHLPAEWQDLVQKERKLLLDIFESVFNHKAFTGRSGTFFAFEGLGSIYWHMVSKLLLAVQENGITALESGSSGAVLGGLLDHYYEIQAGIGVHKSPELYGAFPTDPYSHTPWHRGAQQPGMTGQVKEDVIARIHELGIRIVSGCIQFDPRLLRKDEFYSESTKAHYIDIHGELKSLVLEPGQLLFTFCQVPVVCTMGDRMQVGVKRKGLIPVQSDGDTLEQTYSHSVFSRSGEVEALYVQVNGKMLK
jgi:hypothetical protein